MRTSKELLDRIAALRTRLDRGAVGAESPGPALGAPHVFEQHAARDPLPPGARLTARAARLLREAKDVLADLKSLADDPLVSDESSTVAPLHRESANLLDVVLRNLVALPAEAAAQMRFCEGLAACLQTVQDRVGLLKGTLETRQRDEERLRNLADVVRALVDDHPVTPEPLLRIAQCVAEDAERRLPLRLPPATDRDPATWAAAHGLAVAQVLARVLRAEVPDRARLVERLAPALVFDAGMAALPSDLLLKAGPLDDADRSLLQAHPLEGQRVVARLWPGGGWPVELAGDHHERIDGSGYPHRKDAYDLSEPVRLLAVCDVYTAMISPRPHRSALDPRTALAEVLRMGEDGTLDRGQAEKLLRLSFYPAGSVVLLSDGAIAVVTAPSRAPANPAKATVLLLRGPQGQPPTHPWPMDLADWPSLGIVRALGARDRTQALSRTHPLLVG